MPPSGKSDVVSAARSAREAGVLEERRQPVGEQIEDHQAHEIREPQHRRAETVRPRRRRAPSADLSAPLVARIGGGERMRQPSRDADRAADAAQDARDALASARFLTTMNCADSGSSKSSSTAEHERPDAACDQHARPAEMRDQPRRAQSADRQAAPRSRRTSY